MTTLLPLLSMSCNLLILVGLTYLLSRLEAAEPTFRMALWGGPFGLAMGGIAVILMLASFDDHVGILIDLRSAPLVMAGLLGGPLAAIIAAALATAARFAMGGANHVFIGMAMPMFAAFGVAAWAMGIGTSFRGLLAIGVALAVLRPILTLVTRWTGWLDPPAVHSLFTEIFPFTALFYPAGIVAMGSLSALRGEARGPDGGPADRYPRTGGA